MRVLVISAAFPPMRAGEADHALHLCQKLAAQGMDVELLTSRESAAPTDATFTVSSFMTGWKWLELPRLRRFLKRASPDAVLLMYIGWIYHDHPMITFAPTLCRHLFPSVPFVTLFENAIGSDTGKQSLFTRTIRKAITYWAGQRNIDYEFGTLLRDSTGVIVLSDLHRRYLARLSPAVNEKCVLIPPPAILRVSTEENGQARRRGRALLGLSADELAIAYLGYIYPNKGIETLLQAFQLIMAAAVRKLRLVVIGGILARDRASYADELRDLAASLGIANRVIWTGPYPAESDVASLYLRASDISVLPIDIGVQLNNSSFAAAATHGLPIVATRGNTPEAPFVDGENLLWCRPKDPQSMALAITRLIEDPLLRERLHLGVLKLADDWFSWDRAAARTIAMLTSQ